VNEVLYDLLFANEDQELNNDPESSDKTDKENNELCTDVAGITLWDKVWECCKRKVAALGPFLSWCLLLS
jgi:hypothetical protein